MTRFMIMLTTDVTTLFLGAVADCKEEMMLMVTVLTVGYLAGLVVTHIRKEEN